MENLINFFENKGAKTGRSGLGANVASAWFNKKNNDFQMTFSNEKLLDFNYVKIGTIGEALVIVFYENKPDSNSFKTSKRGTSRKNLCVSGKSLVEVVFEKFGKKLDGQRDRIVVEFEFLTENIISLKKIA